MILATSGLRSHTQFPFWEKIEADKAAAQFNKRIQPLLKMAGDMEVIISETGWPTGGSAKNGSVASHEHRILYTVYHFSIPHLFFVGRSIRSKQSFRHNCSIDKREREADILFGLNDD
ncbi:hypothetical protein PInf_001550 [Phytophthora infestans]|nr:hypothetical protein PInf_000019 [Phytophthora infestans]KAI9997622.1 hypothetical protein PInf_001550 [Phytophthora infestans]